MVNLHTVDLKLCSGLLPENCAIRMKLQIYTFLVLIVCTCKLEAVNDSSSNEANFTDIVVRLFLKILKTDYNTEISRTFRSYSKVLVDQDIFRMQMETV